MSDCRDCTRTKLLRDAVAEAGRGLPEIEPGMPVPAGTGLSRRSFIARSAGIALAVYGGSKLTPWALDDGIAAAAAGKQAPVLVSIFLEGGIDSLSVLFPAGDPEYYTLRPKLALPESVGAAFSEDSRLRWHPAAAALAQLHAEGKVSVLPAIGYNRPDHSHFTSRHYWEVGATDPHVRSGWLGRYLDRSGSADNPLQGLSLDKRLQPALATAKVPIASLDGPDRYGFSANRKPHPLERPMLDAAAQLGAAHAASRDQGLRQVGEAAQQARHLAGELRGFGAIASPVAYPSSVDQFPRRLAGLAAMLGAGLPLHCVALTATGHYDTHATQAEDLQQGLQTTADSLLAFQRDLEARGIADRVLVHVWSEFGRRARENGSLGTDHGAAGIGFLIGSRVRGRMIGEFPGIGPGGLDALGNLRATVDFRGIYAGLIEQWLGADAGAIIPGASAFARPTLLK
ncbi:MAG: DUF1501 domain-containing protein [Gaiellaceae bacterium MAG52_C11]|nr:DUF1501 domain-containing protein [Candidatus Gaiellasilicea maunaloa]